MVESSKFRGVGGGGGAGKDDEVNCGSGKKEEEGGRGERCGGLAPNPVGLGEPRLLQHR